MNKFSSEQKTLIHFAELAALLHDVGKLSRAFIEYRKKWHADPDGYGKDPHDNGFWDGKKEENEKKDVFPDPMLNEFNKLKLLADEVFYKVVKSLNDSELSCNELTVKNIINKHTHGSKELSNILKIFKAADRVDSAQDRNNPLWSAEQCIREIDKDTPEKEQCIREIDKDTPEKQTKPVYSSTPFGYEKSLYCNIGELEYAREKLYTFLQENLEKYYEALKNDNSIEIKKLRKEILGIIKTLLEKGLADTTRPQNDTTLWDHDYAVASIFKVLLAHYFLYGEAVTEFSDVRFQIFGVGWDSFQYLSKSVKIGDMACRRKELDDLTKEIISIFEVEYAIGNHVYKDDDGVYFLIPEKRAENEAKAKDRERYDKILDEIIEKIYEISDNKTKKELRPVFTLLKSENKGTKFITSIVNVIEEIKLKSKAPHNAELKLPKSKGIKISDVCPVCQIRFVDDESEICKECLVKRRSGSDKKKELLHSEIADKNGRLALVVATTDLTRWLNGINVRSLFVTEAHGAKRELDNLGNTKQFKGDEIKLKEVVENTEWLNEEWNYKKLKKALELCQEHEDKHFKPLSILFARRTSDLLNDPFKVFNKYKIIDGWKELIGQSEEENKLFKERIYEKVYYNKDKHLLNILCAKTPTPSTLLSIWHSTENYFEDFKNLFDKKDNTESFGDLLKVFPLEQRPKRVMFKKEQDPIFKTGEIYTGQFKKNDKNPTSIEFIVREEGIFITKPLFNQKDIDEWEKYLGKKITLTNITKDKEKISESNDFTVEKIV